MIRGDITSTVDSDDHVTWICQSAKRDGVTSQRHQVNTTSRDSL